ncbi:MAG: CPBP family intramembrane glutamic endopeptidase [Bacteroidota bacterium]
MFAFLRDEWNALRRAMRGLDAQTVTVLLTATALALVQFTVGSRRLFREHLADFFPEAVQGLLSWGWWFSIQGVTGFVIPVLILVFAFRQRPDEMGLGLGDWKLASVLALLYMPVVTLGTWVLSDQASFQTQYPHYHPAAFDWSTFWIYHALFLFYWIGWEYLWRGYVLFGTARTFGVYAILIQTMPFAILHFRKPLPEAMLSIVGGVALGALVWRCRSFWIAVPIHAYQMFILDFWCALRLRTEVHGIGPAALWELLTTWLQGS